MTRKIIRIGSSAGFIIPKKELEEHGLKIGDEIKRVPIEPVKETSHKKFAAELDKFMDIYDQDLKKSRQAMTNYLSEEEILLAHFKLIERYGGSHGVRNLERVKSVAAAPKQEVFGAEQYPDLFEKAAVYTRNIIDNRPFTDSNKRTGITVAIMFLQRNGKKFKAKKGELEDFAVRVATDYLSVADIVKWFKSTACKFAVMKTGVY